MAECCIDGCEKRAIKRGLCNAHYQREKRLGNISKFDGPGRGRHAPKERIDCAGVHECGKPHVARGLCGACYQLRISSGLISKKPIVNSGKLCSVSGCVKHAKSNGFCTAHYERHRKYGSPLSYAPRKTGVKCSIEGCDCKVVAKGFCSKHYTRFRSHGDPNKLSDRHLKRFEEVVDDNGYVLVPVKGRIATRGNGTRAAKHRVVMAEYLGRPLRKNESVHHINGNRSDNRIENLEIWVTTQPAGQRPLDLLAWAKEIIKLYSKEKSKLEKLNYRDPHAPSLI